jgi:septum site-determining protein MinD
VIEMPPKRIIGVVSGKGGTGKTTTAINLALGMHYLGEPTTLIDTDVTAANMGLHLGLYSMSTKLQDALDNKIDLRDAMYVHPTGLKFIPSSISIDSLKSDISNLKHMLKEMEGTVIIDSPPGLDKEAQKILKLCDEIVIVTNPELPSLTNAVKVIKTAEELNKRILGLVVNKVSGSRHEITPSEIEIMCEHPIITMVPDDISVKESIFEKTPVIDYNPYSPASVGFLRLAHALNGLSYNPPRMLRLRNTLFRMLS